MLGACVVWFLVHGVVPEEADVLGVTDSFLQAGLTSVDIVYTWVNGSDPDWKAIRKSIEKPKSATWDADLDFRYRSHDELRYSLRSVNEYAPWVRNIYVVSCCGQVPSWLDRSYPKVKVVDHKDIIPSDLFDPPTFNSFAIETWVHRIPGLSETFILMNDDFFFGGPVEKTDFFDNQGRPKIAFQEDWGYNAVPPPGKDDAYLWAAHNCDVLLDGKFKKESRYKILHQAYPTTKRLYERAHYLFGRELSDTTKHRFRQRGDVIPHFLASWIGIYDGSAVRLSRYQYPTNTYVKMKNDSKENKNQLLNLLARSGEYKLFCIGDHMDSAGAASITDESIVSFLGAYFPKKAPWEAR